MRSFDVNEWNCNMILVKDRPLNSIQISFMATVPKNNFFMYSINNICDQIISRNKGKNCLDLTGPCAVGRHFMSYFNISEIKMGKHEYIGKDLKKYKVYIPFKEIGDYLSNDDKTIKYVKTKSPNHSKFLYNNNKKKRYDYQWRKNILFNNI